jgi:hypothetical protein|tara:strand:+ start:2544 stop:2936 length:393 start_codon:yes stop_codon:yes gene_type:complete
MAKTSHSSTASYDDRKRHTANASAIVGLGNITGSEADAETRKRVRAPSTARVGAYAFAPGVEGGGKKPSSSSSSSPSSSRAFDALDGARRARTSARGTEVTTARLDAPRSKTRRETDGLDGVAVTGRVIL